MAGSAVYFVARLFTMVWRFSVASVIDLDSCEICYSQRVHESFIAKRLGFLLILTMGDRMEESEKTARRDGFAYVEYKEACSAYFHGVEIGFTVVKHYATLNTLLIVLLGALATVDQKNPILPSPVEVARFVPWIAIVISGLLAFAVPHYWRHLDNCSRRCAQIEGEYGGKLFERIVETSESGRFGSGGGLWVMIFCVSLLWLMFVFRAQIGQLSLVKAFFGILP